MNARAEAFKRLGGRYEVRVLEPSPPAVDEPPYFADDPTARGDVPAGRQLVSPVSTGDILWNDLIAADPALARFCAERWLGAYRRLESLPPSFAVTRMSLHQVGELVMKPAREQANGKFGLRYTRSGFGTPFFGDDVQLRVEGVELIVQEGETERRAPLSTLKDGAQFIGPAILHADPGLDERPLAVDADSVRALGDWYGFVTSVLEELRAGAGTEADLEPSRVQLWPEHFDVAVELGAEAAGRRAAYGGSPGDDNHPDPYIYVAPWSAKPSGDLWQATAFTGAELPYAELLAAENRRATALDFFRTRLRSLAA